MAERRPGKLLLVLDLDHTLLDFSKHSNDAAALANPHVMKRPHMDEFLATCYEHYDLVVRRDR